MAPASQPHSLPSDRPTRAQFLVVANSDSTSLRRLFALSVAVALNIRQGLPETVATPLDRMACKVKDFVVMARSHPLFSTS